MVYRYPRPVIFITVYYSEHYTLQPHRHRNRLAQMASPLSVCLSLWSSSLVSMKTEKVCCPFLHPCFGYILTIMVDNSQIIWESRVVSYLFLPITIGTQKPTVFMLEVLISFGDTLRAKFTAAMGDSCDQISVDKMELVEARIR